MRLVAAFACAVMLICLGGALNVGALAAPASEVVCRGDGTRVALLIGNQDYVGTMQALANPRRDTTAFAGLLCQNGFTVFRHADLDVQSFDATIETFARAAKGTKTALVYYSGHGFAVGRRNWLVPVDAQLGCEDIAGDGSDVTRLRRRLVDLDEDVLSRLEGAGDQIVILDACRTDPVRGCRGGATPSLIKGLVRPMSSSARLIVYATQDGQVALDNVKGSETSPLITAMLKRLPENPRRDWVTAMLDVSEEVLTLTRNKQRPNIDVNLRPKGCLAFDCGGPQLSEVALAWGAVQETTSQLVLEDFIRRYGDTIYGTMARERLDQLKKPQVALVAPPVRPKPPALQSDQGAQRAVLYEEDAGDSQSKRFAGTVVWRTETVSLGPGLAAELAVRGDVEIPERKMKMTWSLRRNTDKALPASHTIEITFTLPPDFPSGGIANVPGILMKQAEQTRGVPLSGLAVKVINNFFLVGLSSVEEEMTRNTELLKDRSWFDVPIVYTDGHRAILALDKGTPGERAFNEAFAAWGQPAPVPSVHLDRMPRREQ